jgi:hypothetical protein
MKSVQYRESRHTSFLYDDLTTDFDAAVDRREFAFRQTEFEFSSTCRISTRDAIAWDHTSESS